MITNVEQVQTQNIMQHLTAVPYDVTRHTLYCAADLYQGYDPDQPDDELRVLQDRALDDGGVNVL